MSVAEGRGPAVRAPRSARSRGDERLDPAHDARVPPVRVVAVRSFVAWFLSAACGGLEIPSGVSWLATFESTSSDGDVSAAEVTSLTGLFSRSDAELDEPAGGLVVIGYGADELVRIATDPSRIGTDAIAALRGCGARLPSPSFIAAERAPTRLPAFTAPWVSEAACRLPAAFALPTTAMCGGSGCTPEVSVEGCCVRVDLERCGGPIVEALLDGTGRAFADGADGCRLESANPFVVSATCGSTTCGVDLTPGTEWTCTAVGCSVGACRRGFDDCDGAGANGCEADLASAETCGACDRRCASDQRCEAGECACRAGRADCDASVAGCETSTETDPAACGACGRSCGDSASCTNGECACVDGRLDCNQREADGCESDPSLDAENCGMCGRACPAGVSCTNGACACATTELGRGDTASLSRDGRAVAILEAGAAWLSLNGARARVDVSREGLPGDGPVSSVSISADATHLAFASRATNLDSLSRPELASIATNAAFPSIAVGADGLPLVAWMDVATFEIKVAKCSDVACSSAVSPTLLGSAGAGGYVTIAIAPSGLPAVTYYDDDAGDLVYVACGNSACSAGNRLSRVDSAGFVGAHASLAFGSDGFAVIAYFAIQNRDLKVAKCGDAECTSAVRSIVDTRGFVGTETSIVVRSDGRPVIAYREELKSILRVAVCGDAACSTGNQLHDVSIGGASSSIALLEGEVPIIAHETSEGGIEVVTCADAECVAVRSTRVIAPAGRAPSMAFDDDGHPAVAIARQDGIGIVRCADPSCDSFTASATVSAVGSYEVDLALDASRVYLAFRDEPAGELRAGSCFLAACGHDDGIEDVFVVGPNGPGRISLGPLGSPANGASTAPSISEDGGAVAFVSSASNLVNDDRNGRADVFVWTRVGAIERVAPLGIEPDGASGEPSISADARYVAFVSEATNLGGPPGVFVYDRILGELRALPGGAARHSPKVRGAHIVTLGQGVWVHDLVAESFVQEAEGTSADLDEDARFLVASDGASVGVTDRASGVHTLVAEPGTRPSISLDGSVIAYSHGSDLAMRSPCIAR